MGNASVSVATQAAEPQDVVAGGASELAGRLRRGSEYVVIPLLSLLVSTALFSLFLMAVGKSPADFFDLVYRGGFGSAFSFQNTLQRASPLIASGPKSTCVRLRWVMSPGLP